jgi:GT2 family glycosyltransferase
VPVFNKLEHTKSMYQSLLNSLPKNLTYEIIFIDDCSQDQTCEWLETLKNSKVKFFSNSINLGYAKSNNLGEKNSKGNILCFLNNDLLFQPGWLDSMLEVYESLNNSIGILGNIQYKISDNEIDHAGVFINLNGQIEHLKSLHSKNDRIFRTFAVTGACFLIARSTFLEAGAFDEEYLNGSEDFDLCFKVRTLGKEILIDSGSYVFHHVGLTRGINSFLNEKNSNYFYKKWRSEIKSELSKNWLSALKSNLPETNKIIDGFLTDSFKLSTNSSSLIIAENIILMHEHRWSKLIDGIDFNSNLIKKIKFKGLRLIDRYNFYLLNADEQLVILDKEIRSIVNFYLCGRKINSNDSESIAVTIYINDTQYKVIELDQTSPNINVGIISPILINGISNVLKFKFNYINDITKELKGDANAAVYISHFVIDDKEIKPIN